MPVGGKKMDRSLHLPVQTYTEAACNLKWMIRVHFSQQVDC
jgi:hypothetical protein